MMKYVIAMVAAVLLIGTGSAYSMLGQLAIDEVLNNEGIQHITQSSTDGTGYVVTVMQGDVTSVMTAVGAVAATLVMEGQPTHNAVVGYPTSGNTGVAMKISYYDAKYILDLIAEGDSEGAAVYVMSMEVTQVTF